MLPQGIFAVAVTTVLFPTLARLAARGDTRGLRRALDGGLRQIAFLLVPAGLVSIVLAEPIVRLVYQRGEFTAEDTTIVAQCLQAFSIGLVFNGWVLILNRSFYAVQTNWTPTAIALGAVALNAVFDAVFYRLGIWGIPLATSTVNVVAAIVLLVMMRRRIGLEHVATYARRSSPRRRSRARRRRGSRSRPGTGSTRSLGDGSLAQVAVARRRVRRGRPRVRRRSPGRSGFASSRRCYCCEPGATTPRRSAEPYGAGPHSQLRDHRAHRPRQVDARRSHPRADRRRLRARHARAAPRLDGARARARDHDQGAGRARELARPPAQPHRHAGARRLHVRGVALAPGVRGRAPRRRRGAGDRGPDARQRVPRDRRRARDRPGREQDRPPAGRSRRRRDGAGRAPRRGARARAAHLREDRRRRPGGARRDRRADPAARRRSRRAGPRPRLRLVVRPVPRRRRVRPRRRRELRDARAVARDGAGHGVRRRGARRHVARARARRVALGRRGRLRHHRASRTSRGSASATRSRRAGAPRPSRCPATRT